jgi:hypothetical protein
MAAMKAESERILGNVSVAMHDFAATAAFKKVQEDWLQVLFSPVAPEV